MFRFDRFSSLLLPAILLAPGALAAVVLPPDGDGILPWEIDSSRFGGSVACPNWSEQLGAQGIPSAYRTWTYGRPCQIESRRHWELFEETWYLDSDERFHYEPGSNRLVSTSGVGRERPAPGLPRTVPSTTDTARYFWRDGQLDSIWRQHWQDSGYGLPAGSTTTTSRFTWKDGRPIARYDEVTGKDNGCIRQSKLSATFRGDTLVGLVDSALYRAATSATCSMAPFVEKKAWRFRPDTVETFITSWFADSTRRVPPVARLFVLRPDGQTQLEIISEPDSPSAGWWLVRRPSDLVLSYSYDGRGRQSELLLDADTWQWREAYHYDEPSPLPVHGSAPRSSLAALRVVGGRVRFELSRPTAVSVALVSPDGRAISLARKLPLAAGPRSLALPADLPRGVWIVRVEGVGVQLSAPWINTLR